MNVVRGVVLMLSCLAFATQAGDPLPPQSLYRLTIPLVRQDGTPATLELHRGSPVLISMFYASCPHACPLLINGMRRMEQQLPAASRDRLKVLLVSIDPDKDTPEKLAELAARHRVDAARWTFARVSSDDVRKLAAALGIRYRKLPDGEFNHSTVVSLLDENGQIVQRTSEITVLDAAFVEELRQLVARRAVTSTD